MFSKGIASGLLLRPRDQLDSPQVKANWRVTLPGRRSLMEGWGSDVDFTLGLLTTSSATWRRTSKCRLGGKGVSRLVPWCYTARSVGAKWLGKRSRKSIADWLTKSISAGWRKRQQGGGSRTWFCRNLARCSIHNMKANTSPSAQRTSLTGHGEG